MRQFAITLLLLFSAAASAQSFKIKEQTDPLTKQNMVVAESLKLCQIKDAGLMAKCAQLRFLWLPKHPDFVLVRVDIPEITSVLKLSINIDGDVKTFSSSEPITDINVYRGYGISPTSGNSFLLPLTAFQSLANNKEFGIMRVTGTHNSIDYDFWRKAKARGLPADELRELLADLESRKSSTQ